MSISLIESSIVHHINAFATNEAAC